jgi:hypothetical protein
MTVSIHVQYPVPFTDPLQMCILSAVYVLSRCYVTFQD